ncbi:aminoglycoside phosphotransferase (APT) family kinase protein [Actinokineospora baliensis]|nr:aminoglycoside phosphotransferase (APT) family kinase protein [Actinokineospora baliensis]
MRLADGWVVRIGAFGTQDSACRQLAVARWLAEVGVPAVEAHPDPDQPVVVDGRPVTVWRELPDHRRGRPREIANALRSLHDQPIPGGLGLLPLNPVAGLSDRVDAAHTLTESDRGWLRDRITRLAGDYADLPRGLPHRVLHGDAWPGNIVTTTTGVPTTLLIDLERVSVGPPEWDLVSTAIKRFSFGTITGDEYAEFTGGYGHDVTNWPGYRLLRDLRETRMTCWLAARAARDADLHREAGHRIACLRGLHGPRPWTWASTG